MTTLRFLVALIALAGAVQVAAADTAPPSRRTFSATVDVDATGKVTQVGVGPSVPRGLVDVIKQAAAIAEFEPALLNGVPAKSRTLLNVTFEMVVSGNDLRAEVVGLSSGGGSLQSQQPRYPSSAVRDRVAAKAWVRASFGADGKLVASESGVENLVMARNGRRLGEDQAGRYAAQFRRAVEDTLAGWVYTPDEVAGRAIAASVWVPMTFCPPGPRASCDLVDLDAPNPGPTLPASLDGSVRLAVMKPYGAADAEG